MRKRINPNAVCSSENYSASKRVYINKIKRDHEAFSLMALSKIREEKEEELTFERRMALQKMKERDSYVYVKCFGKATKITKERYEKYYKPYGIEAVDPSKVKRSLKK